MMKNLTLLLGVVLFLANCSQPENANQTSIEIPDNPFYPDFNTTIDFASISSEEVTEATETIQKITDTRLANILAINTESRTFENTMKALDELVANFNAVASAVYLMSYTHPDSLIRTTALNSNTVLSQYYNEISLNEGLYHAVKAFASSEGVESLQQYQKKFLDQTVEDFERNGFALSQEERDKLKEIKNQLSTIGDEFSKNIASFEDYLVVGEADMAGLPDDYKEARKQADGTYTVDLSYPSYRPFMKYADSDEARKALFIKYNNRAASANLEVLTQLLQKRLEMAKLLGYQTYSEYRLEDRMAKDPRTVWEFETNLKNDLSEKLQLDKAELLEAKTSRVGKSEKVNGWEASYYNNILLEEKYQLDDAEVKQYFALNDVLDGLFMITQTIFSLEYKEVENPSVWHEDVRMFEVYQDGKLKGVFYLDLHPRANKYKHAACFGIVNGRMTQKGYRIPNASLVCNFPKATSDKPALMPHSQVETFFHEFGHVLHQMVTTADLYSQSGTNVSRDFVEAPSQIFENWAWNYDAVKLFAKHYETREVLPEALFNKMLAAKNVGSASGALQQVFYGTFDLTLHDKYDPNSDESTTDVLRKLQNEISAYEYVEGTHFQAAFGHLNGYGSSYYGYLWSLVYAQDMFSIFDKKGILDKETGLRYRDIILAKGSSDDEINLVKEFLGREPNNDAFLKELGL